MRASPGPQRAEMDHADEVERLCESHADGATLIRSLIVILTGGVIVAGAVYVVRGGPPESHGQFDGNFFGLVADALLPSAVYFLSETKYLGVPCS